MGFARQLVVEHAKGSYIVWMDGDIILSKSYIKQQVEFMERNPSVGVAVGSFGVLENDNWIAALENLEYVIQSLNHNEGPTSKLLGTEGAIFRVAAVRGVGGFNKKIKGAQEDRDLAYRLKKAKWDFNVTKAVFYERQRDTWKALYKQYYWYGYGLHYMQSVHADRNRATDMSESNDRVVFSLYAYKLTHRKIVFLLPLNYVFKKTALLVGFIMAHIDGYGHIYKAKE